MFRGFARGDHHAAAGRFAPARGAANLERLAGDDRGCGVADVHRIGVHHPRHDLRVSVDVRRRHVFLRADRVDDFGDVAPRQRFDFALRHLGRVANHAAFAAAERNVRDRAFPRHPRGQRGDFVERDARVIANAALRRTERDVVLDAIAGEYLDLAVVHLDRARHDDLSLRMGEDLPDARFEVEDARRSIELLEHVIEDRSVIRHVAPKWNRPKYRGLLHLVNCYLLQSDRVLGFLRERWWYVAGKSNHKDTEPQRRTVSVRRVGCRRQPDGRTPRSANTKRTGAGRLVFTDRGVLPRRYAPLTGLDGPHVFAARRRASTPRLKLR